MLSEEGNKHWNKKIVKNKRNKKIVKKKQIKKFNVSTNSSYSDKVHNHFQDLKNLYQRKIEVNGLEQRFKKEKENLNIITDFNQRIYNLKAKQ